MSIPDGIKSIKHRQYLQSCCSYTIDETTGVSRAICWSRSKWVRYPPRLQSACEREGAQALLVDTGWWNRRACVSFERGQVLSLDPGWRNGQTSVMSECRLMLGPDPYGSWRLTSAVVPAAARATDGLSAGTSRTRPRGQCARSVLGARSAADSEPVRVPERHGCPRGLAGGVRRSRYMTPSRAIRRSWQRRNGAL